MNYNECINLNVKDLRQRLSDLKISGRSRLTTKDEMCNELIKYYSGSSPVPYINNSYSSINSQIPLNVPVNLQNKIYPVAPPFPINMHETITLNNQNIPISQNINVPNIPILQNINVPNIPILQNINVPNIPIPQNINAPNIPISQNINVSNIPISQNINVPNKLISQNINIPVAEPSQSQNLNIQIGASLRSQNNNFDSYILKNILYNADKSTMAEILDLCNVNKNTRELCNDDTFWKQKYIKDFGSRGKYVKNDNKGHVDNIYNIDWITMYKYMILYNVLNKNTNRYCLERRECKIYMGLMKSYDNYILYDISHIDKDNQEFFVPYKDRKRSFYFKAKIKMVDLMGNNIDEDYDEIIIEITGFRFKSPLDIIESTLNLGLEIYYSNIDSTASEKDVSKMRFTSVGYNDVCSKSGIRINNPLDLLLITDCPRDATGKELPVPNLIVYVLRASSLNLGYIRHRVIEVNDEFTHMKISPIDESVELSRSFSNEIISCDYGRYYEQYNIAKTPKQYTHGWYITKDRNNTGLVFKHDCSELYDGKILRHSYSI